jgi:CelD/BcsL family acetyltransferase involved in cellulose biosynthesis
LYRIASEPAFDFLSPEYATLFNASCATAFQHPLWLDGLYRRLGPAHAAEPLVITARDCTNNRLAMLLPLLRRRYGPLRVIEFADLRVSDYAAPVCDADTFDAIEQHKLAGAIRQLLKPYDLLRIGKLEETALPLERLIGTAPRLPLKMSAHAVTLGRSYDEWRSASIDRSYRKELDKKHRQLARKGYLTFDCAHGPDQIKSAIEALRQYRGSRFPDDLLQQDSYFEFYLEIAIKGAGGGFSRTYVLAIDGRPIAVLWGLASDHRFLILMSGFDLAPFKNQSIGALTFGEVARDCIERGDAMLDFTIGDESYKGLFGAQPTSMWMIADSGSSLGSIVNVVATKVPGAAKLAKDLRNWKAWKRAAVA